MSAKTKPIELEHCVEIYVPTQCRCGNALPEDIRDEVLEEVKSKMAEWFQGGSVKKTDLRVERIDGFWELKSGDIAGESNHVVYSNCTQSALEEHHEEFITLTASIAQRLTQEAAACRIDAKMLIFEAADTRPHRCAGGEFDGALPTPRQPDEKERMRALQASLQRISSLRDARDLFCKVLHYEFEDEQLTTAGWPDKLKACLAPGTAPRIIADQNGFKILYIQLADTSLRRGHEREIIQRLIKDDPTLRGLVAVSNVDQNEWHLVNAKFEKKEAKKGSLRLRRMRVGSGQSVRTAVERLAMVDIETAGEDVTAAQLQDLHDEAFDVEKVSREFFNEISNWYFWALSRVEFPTDTLSGDDDEKHRATSLIRFLTRIIFCWFLKEKDLIPPSLFNEKDLADILSDLADDSCSYHQGILQNLFFATLNQRMGKDSKGNPYRAFAKDEGFVKNRSTYSVDTLYRYEEHFQDPDKALSHFAEVPFLNGGLFECLDRTDEDSGKKLYVDGFSRNKKKRARVPNELFFSGGQTVDLSGPEAYGTNGYQNTKVRGLLNILHAYNFTVEENTPIDEEIALDPELLGKVFENLLASYNEETKTTARKQTGSFYTPRPIVEYMVDESLKAHLCGTLTNLGRKEEEAREQLDLLLGYTDEEPSFSEEEIDVLLEAIHTCKILDPACGSGAFPIGMLQKLVHVVHKLDLENARWKQLQIKSAEAIPDPSAKSAAIKAIEEDFEENGDDYGRKLYLIENCLYGVDIQPIAIQITKLRFFISLICDQKTNRNKAKNHGIRALPNLETKFVAADTLIGLPEMDQSLLVDPRVGKIEKEIESLYHRHFGIQRRNQKRALQSRVKELRQQLGDILAESLMAPAKAQHVAQWDPFDPQATSDFFDPFWMFGIFAGKKTQKDTASMSGSFSIIADDEPTATTNESEGFDIVIGNPPYIQIQKFPANQKAIWQAQDFKTYAATADIYCLFYERGAQLLKDGAHLCYITSNKWMRAGYGTKLRRFLSSEVDTTAVLDFGMSQNFGAATTYTCVVSLAKHAYTQQTLSCYAKDDRAAMSDPSAYFEENRVIQTHLSSDPWVVLTRERQHIKDLVEKQGAPLSKWDLQIYRGILTGLNDAFYITQDQRDALIAEDPASEELIVPLLRGRFIERYGTNWNGEYMINSHNGVRQTNIPPVNVKRDYPAIWRHLSQWEEKLRKRQDKGDHWSNLRNCAYIEEFSKPKIIYPNMTKFLPFYYDRDDGSFGNQKCFIITSQSGGLGYLTAFLNSALFKCCFRDNFPELLGNTYELSKIFIDILPVRKPTTNEIELFEKIIPLVQLAKAEGRSGAYKFLEDLIDACVMECYFRDHMAELDLLLIEDLGPHLDGYDQSAGETKQRDFLEHFHSTLHAKGSKIRDRLDRICTDSPDLLEFIKKEGKV